MSSAETSAIRRSAPAVGFAHTCEVIKWWDKDNRCAPGPLGMPWLARIHVLMPDHVSDHQPTLQRVRSRRHSDAPRAQSGRSVAVPRHPSQRSRPQNPLYDGTRIRPSDSIVKGHQRQLVVFSALVVRGAPRDACTRRYSRLRADRRPPLPSPFMGSTTQGGGNLLPHRGRSVYEVKVGETRLKKHLPRGRSQIGKRMLP